jgi:hypothetical protein
MTCPDCLPIWSRFCDEPPDFEGMELCPKHAATDDLLAAAQMGIGALEALVAIAQDAPAVGTACPGLYSVLSKVKAAIAKAEKGE